MKIRYRWAIYFTWNDGTEDSFNVETIRERDANIKDMIRSGKYKNIRFCRIYANGEYGIDIIVK